MPEGPEVKIVADYLNKFLKNKKISSFSHCSKPYKIKYGEVIKSLKEYVPLDFQDFSVLVKQVF